MFNWKVEQPVETVITANFWSDFDMCLGGRKRRREGKRVSTGEEKRVVTRKPFISRRKRRSSYRKRSVCTIIFYHFLFRTYLNKTTVPKNFIFGLNGDTVLHWLKKLLWNFKQQINGWISGKVSNLKSLWETNAIYKKPVIREDYKKGNKKIATQ